MPKVVWSPATRLHEPKGEVWVGVPTPGTEVPERVDRILAALTRARIRGPRGDRARRLDPPSRPRSRLPVAPRARPRRVDAIRDPGPRRPGSGRPVPVRDGCDARRPARPASPVAVHARAGVYCYDTMTLVGPGTWAAARAAVDCALTAVDLVAAGAPLRVRAVPSAGPPRDPFGLRRLVLPEQRGGRGPGPSRRGSRARRHRRRRRALRQRHGLDLLRPPRRLLRVACTSIRAPAGSRMSWASPPRPASATGGHDPERAPRARDRRPRLARRRRGLADAVRRHRSTALVVSLGVDAAADDPESPLRVTRDGYGRAGELLHELGLPTVMVQEGGYHLDSLGGLVRAFVERFRTDPHQARVGASSWRRLWRRRGRAARPWAR